MFYKRTDTSYIKASIYIKIRKTYMKGGGLTNCGFFSIGLSSFDTTPFLIFRKSGGGVFFLFLAPAGVYDPADLYLDFFPNPLGKI